MKINEELHVDIEGKAVNILGLAINHDNCDLCEACVTACTVGKLVVGEGRIEIVNGKICTKCEACILACPNYAITV